MKEQFKVSIIVAVYKAEAFLEQLVDSLISQTYKNLEILLIDDGSPDRCPEICDFYAEKDSRIRVIHKENGGASTARNIGVKEATGDALILLDSDDYIEPDTVEYAVSVMQSENADVVMWNYIREFKDKSKPKIIFENDVVFEGEELENLKRRFFGLYREELKSPDRAEALSPLWGKLYKKELFDLCPVGCIDAKVVGSSEDALWNSRIFRNVKRAVFVNKYFHHYRKYNENSITSGYKAGLCEKWDVLDGYFREYIDELKLSEDYTEALDNRLCVNIITLGLNVLENKDFSYLQRVKEIRRILSKENYRRAYKKLKLRYFSPHFFVFFFFAKYRMVHCLHLMLCVMKGLMK